MVQKSDRNPNQTSPSPSDPATPTDTPQKTPPAMNETNKSPIRASRTTRMRDQTSPKRGDTAVPPVSPFRSTAPDGTQQSFARCLTNYEHWVRTKTGTEDPTRWHPVALRQLPLMINQSDVDCYHNHIESHPEWDYTEVQLKH